MEKEKELEATPSQPEDAKDNEASTQPSPDKTRRQNARQQTTPRADERDENFGNRKDYKPNQAIGGYYREPMSGGDQWNRRNNRHHRGHQQPREIEGVLSVNQPGWQQHLARQMEQDRGNVLTMRQQEHTSQALDRNRPNRSLRSHEQRAQDPDAVWSRFMDDLKRGKIHPDGRPKRNNHNQHKQRKHNKPHNKENTQAQNNPPIESQDKEKE